MADADQLLLGEFPRSVDERFRLAIPTELLSLLNRAGSDAILAKERPGCLSLWNAAKWQSRLQQAVDLVRAKVEAGKLEGRLQEVQLLGRLLSTRHRPTAIDGRGRILIPEGFREFLQVESGGDVVVVGAAICVEIWRPDAWLAYLERRMPRFRRLLDELSG